MELLKQYGYTLVFCVVMLEQLGLPIPATPVLILAGALAAGGHLNLALVLAAAAIACLLGDFVWYWIGKRKGRGILKILCHLSLSPESCVKKTETSFHKYGMNSLLFAKFIPGLNTIAPPMAGMFSSSLFAFLWRDILGSIAYTGLFIAIGFVFEMAVFDVTALLETFGRTLFWIIIGGLALYVISKYVKLKLLQKLLFRERITPEELHERMSAGEPLLVVDIRANVPADNNLMIPGALRIPPGEVDQYMHLLDKERWIIMYCT